MPLQGLQLTSTSLCRLWHQALQDNSRRRIRFSVHSVVIRSSRCPRQVILSSGTGFSQHDLEVALDKELQCRFHVRSWVGDIDFFVWISWRLGNDCESWNGGACKNVSYIIKNDSILPAFVNGYQNSAQKLLHVLGDLYKSQKKTYLFLNLIWNIAHRALRESQWPVVTRKNIYWLVFWNLKIRTSKNQT